MSNKIQLQTNNITLDSYITRINTVKDIAASLPEAGGGAQVAPVISVDSNGIITATAGSNTSTHLLPFQPAKTITPTLVSQVAISSGYYAGGNITVLGDSNLVAENIKKGVSIFGVNGTLVEGDTDIEDAIISKTLSNYTNNRISYVGSYMFYKCSSLKSVSFPFATYIGENAFQFCSSLNNVSFPAVKSIGSYAFSDCTALKSVDFPAVISIRGYAFRSCNSLVNISFPVATNISSNAFQFCTSLQNVNFPAVKSIGSYAFANCSKLEVASFPAAIYISKHAFSSCFRLKSLYLDGSSVCSLGYSDAFKSTPIGGYSTSAGTYGSIYVPASLVNSYKTATNWTYFSSRIVGV